MYWETDIKRRETEMSARNRELLEKTIYNLRFDMDCIGDEVEMFAELAAMSDADLEKVLNDLLSNL